MKRWLWLSTCGSIGYAPASGTMATIVTLPFVYAVQYFVGWNSTYVFCVSLITVLSFYIVSIAAPSFKIPDPKMVVLDEVVGTFVTFIFIIPRLKSMFIGACLFRFFDITKWFGISRLQKYHGAKGILIDDIASGIFANILLRGLLAYGYI